MTLTIRCNCGAMYVIDDNDDEDNGTDPGDITSNPADRQPTDVYLGFTTPALGGGDQ